MVVSLSGASKVFGIIGHPVRHSLSPAMQNAAMQAGGLDGVYVPFDVRPEELGEAVAGLRALGVRGANVTIPHKVGIIPYLDGLDESAAAAGAVNTVNNEDGRLIGYNTDGDGLVRSLAEECAFLPERSTVVIIGAGGAARGAVAAICRAGARRVIVANRSKDRAAALVAAMAERYPGVALMVAEYGEQMTTSLHEAGLVVNTTSLGMNNEVIAGLDLGALPPTCVVYDMVYAPPVTPLLQEARRLGLRHANGLGMLAAQGELAFRIWTGKMPPPGLMKRILTEICAA
ncbi:shikimate dehydrogenase [Oryzomonas sagensis]|uniref:Shikimate dehydrogenase (NADP(+)) n=1 Tax=Oryzomonas sagensis TaxID=2603857 RepID=A0ABQ6TMI7_9BACT|nr:shikimate dehydrogenase [Oryzomonas sagensis]KAB0669662.1 shikimate dehydrogenase [Oryzomonas sagensis]